MANSFLFSKYRMVPAMRTAAVSHPRNANHHVLQNGGTISKCTDAGNEVVEVPETTARTSNVYVSGNNAAKVTSLWC
jgi:hypothetical protein